MEFLIFESAKRGSSPDQNEDAVRLSKLSERAHLLVMSDGATTGIFSREWSHHIVQKFDPQWLANTMAFEAGLSKLRAAFKPATERPTALRKFLMEGSYATLLAVRIVQTGFFWRKLRMTCFSVGDVCLFRFSRGGEFQHSFPVTKQDQLNNSPDLVRSSESLQRKSPYTVKGDEFTIAGDGLVAIASDALAAHLLGSIERGEGYSLLQQIVQCDDAAAFESLMEIFRTTGGMKNDDVTIALFSARPDLHFRKQG